MPDDTDAEGVIRALDKVGVDFSIAKSALIDFLGNAEFTPYPAMSGALLNLLNSRGLKRPVFIDVIVFNYEHSPGEPSPRRVEDVDIGILQAAVLEGFNERYAQQEPAFSGLLKPLDVPQPPVPPVQTLAMTAEGTVSVQGGVTLVDTDNPRVEVTAKLITVNSEAAHAMVPQELHREDNGWRFTNGDVRLSVSNGEADAGLRPVRAGSLSDDASPGPPWTEPSAAPPGRKSGCSPGSGSATARSTSNCSSRAPRASPPTRPRRAASRSTRRCSSSPSKSRASSPTPSPSRTSR
ncbi:hypothetical protein AB0C81_24815 [Streptomyces roseoverticillatus]|uniref:hypothetical protein n=1 Tax=Streptomyces roseoverticillatus TaxID=66429 RepID=UPI0033CC5607